MIASSSDDTASRRRRTIAIAGAGLVVAMVAWLAFLLFLLPSGPEVIWVKVFDLLNPKRSTRAAEEPGAPFLYYGYFCDPPGHGFRDRWDDALGVELVCETPFGMQVVQHATGGQHEIESVYASYRATPERRVIDGVTWVRYERAD